MPDNRKNKFALYEGIIFIKQNPQIIYSLFLIVAIPALFFIATAYILNIFNKQLDRNLKQQGVMLARSTEKFIAQSIYSQSIQKKEDLSLQEKIIALKNSSDLIKDIAVFVRSETKTDYFKIIASLNPKDINSEIQSVINSLAWQHNQTFARLLQDKRSGEKYWLSATPIHNENNEIIGIVSVALSRLEADQVVGYLGRILYLFSTVFSLILILLVANHARLFQYAVLLMKLKEIDRLKDEFLSITSHELRTPLTTIRGYLSMIQEGSFGELSEKLKHGIDVVMLEVQRLYDLVEDLLEVSRIEQGRIKIEKEKILLPDFISEICNEISPKVKEKGLVFNFVNHLEENKKIEIESDRDRLKQVLINLIGNAIKYTLKGSIEVGLTLEEKNFISIYVKDTGIGISAQDQEKLFSKFFRVQSEETSKISGTGLGLWITKKVIELLGGKIYLESIKGQGSKFTVFLPMTTS